MRNQYVPMPRFIQDTPRGRMEWDPYSRLANDRIIFLGTPVDDTVANLIIAQLLILESEDPDKDVVMYVNSPRRRDHGPLRDLRHDAVHQADVQTICIGQAASAAACAARVGRAWKRFILPHARVLIHQPHGGASDRRSTSRSDPGRARSRACASCSTRSWRSTPGSRSSASRKILTRDFIMSAVDAADYGLVDEVITNRELAAVPSAESTN